MVNEKEGVVLLRKENKVSKKHPERSSEKIQLLKNASRELAQQEEEVNEEESSKESQDG
ncbi:hypothetical protein FJ208_02635 [Candidatus Gribaldobacteria bacterium]|nr:hypothetical protein [Candidatus Gribaldobacteria bacterium]